MIKENQKTEEFLAHLEKRALTQGWEVDLRFKAATPHIRFRCPHGKVCKEDIYPESLTEFPSVKGVADQYFRRAVNFCKGNHEEQKYLTVWPTLKSPQLIPMYGYIKVNAESIKMSADSVATSFKNMTDEMWKTVILSSNTTTWTPLPTYTPLKEGAVEMNWYVGGGHPVLSHLSQACPALETVQVKCPLEHCPYNGALGAIIPHINDTHHWTREQIADWLETLDVDLTIQRVSKEKSVAKHSVSTAVQKASVASGVTAVLAAAGVLNY